jgi:hypothetical protein
VTSIYDEIKKLYDALNEGEIKTAKDLLGSLISKGVNKDFISDGFKTLGFTRQMEVLYDELEKNKKTAK